MKPNLKKILIIAAVLIAVLLILAYNFTCSSGNPLCRLLLKPRNLPVAI